jgi:hypothetical protein
VDINKEVKIKERGFEYTYGGPERYMQGLGGET